MDAEIAARRDYENNKCWEVRPSGNPKTHADQIAEKEEFRDKNLAKQLAECAKDGY